MTLIITTSTENIKAILTKNEIKAVVEPLLKKRNLKGKWLLEVRFVDKNTIKKLNSKSRQINEPTDVLSFPVRFSTNNENPDKIIPTNGIQVLGSLVISPEVTAEKAADRRITFNEELLFLIEHGLRHLLGEDHNDEGNWLISKL